MAKNTKSHAEGADEINSPEVTHAGLGFSKKMLFGFVATVLFFGIIEGALRLVGFQADARVERMEFSFPVDDYNKSAPQRYLERDEQLFWKPIPGALGHNSKGFYGPEFQIAKPDGVFRIVCLGDSCTHFGPISYPDILRGLLERLAPGEFEVINASCIGYTSFQGRTLLEKQVLDWSPNLITVYFGWNDHWLARGLEDRKQQASQLGDEAMMLDSLRMIQLLRMIKSKRTTHEEIMRVPLTEYEKNLMAMSEQSSAKGADTWFITAPHALDLGIPPYLVSSGEVSSLDGLIPMHQAYNQTVRDVAKQQHAGLIDLERETDTMNKLGLFIEDHIHLSENGKILVANRLIEMLRSRGILKIKR